VPLPKRGPRPQIFGPCLLWPNGWMDEAGTWHEGRPWSSPQCARWGHSSSPPKRVQSPQFSAHLYCGQTAGCIKMPLGMEVGLSPGNIVFDVDPATHRKRTHPRPIQFLAHVCCGHRPMAGWMKDAAPLGTEVDLGPGHIVLDGVPAPAKGAQQPPYFRPMSIVATVAHLSYC